MKILLVYSMIPETTRVYILEDVGQDELQKLVLCNGNYANCTGGDEVVEATNWLNQWLEGQTPVAGDDIKSGPLDLFDQKFDYLIISGFVL